ncbi:MAG: hypothetical protein ACLUW6_06545 [Coriobacteriaceae bacterium]
MLSSDHCEPGERHSDASRIESGKMSFNETSSAFRTPDRGAGHVRREGDTVGIDLTIDVDSPAHPQVVTDPLRLNQILVNTGAMR